MTARAAYRPAEAEERKAELARLLSSPGINAALLARLEQLIRFGHSADADAALPPHVLIDKARDYLAIAGDRAHDGGRQDLTGAWKKTAQAAALAFAALDRLAREPALSEKLFKEEIHG